LCWPCDTLYLQKLALTSPISGGRSVGIVRLRTKATEFGLVLVNSLEQSQFWGDGKRNSSLTESVSFKPCTSEPATGPYSKSDESSPHSYTTFLATVFLTLFSLLRLSILSHHVSIKIWYVFLISLEGINFPAHLSSLDFITIIISGEVKLSNWALYHEGVWRNGYIDPYFLDLGTTWRWVVSFTPRSLYPRGKSPSTHWIGGWMGPRANLDDVE
jgi:hypothetical protein